MGAIARTALALALLGLSCAPSAPPVVLCYATGLPAGAAAIQALVTLNGAGAPAPLRFELGAVFSGERSFALRLPDGASGQVQVALGVRDARGCLVASGLGEASLAGTAEERAKLVVPLQPGTPPKSCVPDKIPEVLAVTPALLPPAAATPLTVRGFGFTPEQPLHVRGQAAALLAPASPVELRAQPPAGAADPANSLGPAEVSVRGPGAGRSDLLRYHASQLRFSSQILTITPEQLPPPQKMELSQTDITLADVDGDRRLDLLVLFRQDVPNANPFLGRVYLMRNAGGDLPAALDPDPRKDRALRRERLFSTNVAPALTGLKQSTAMSAGDLNRDGMADLVLSGNSDSGADQGNLAVLRAEGGTFAAPVSVPFKVTGSGNGKLLPGNVTLADLDGDGDLDVFGAGFCEIDGCAFGLRNSGDGTLSPDGGLRARILDVDTTRALSTAVGDLDGDRVPDLVVTGQLAGAGTIRVGAVNLYLSRGGSVSDAGERMTFRGTAPLLRIPARTQLLDVNHDGNLDLLHSWSEAIAASVALGGGDGTFEPDGGHTYPAGGGAVLLGAADLDGDGWEDLVLGSSAVHVLRNQRDGTFPEALPNAFPVEAGYSARAAAAIGDLDGDGRLDLVVRTSRYGFTILWNDSE